MKGESTMIKTSKTNQIQLIDLLHSFYSNRAPFSVVSLDS